MLRSAVISMEALPMYNPEIDRLLTEFVQDAIRGPFGPIPLQRVISNYLGMFDELRKIGVPWDAIALRMSSEGIDKPAKWWRTAYSVASAAARERSRTGGKKRAIRPELQSAEHAVPATPPEPLGTRTSLKALLPSAHPSRQSGTMITIKKETS